MANNRNSKSTYLDKDEIYDNEEDLDESENIEEEDDEEEEPFDPNKIKINFKTFSVLYIKELIDNNLKETQNIRKLNLEPNYQRHKVWSPKKQSLFIESLILGIPIPIFYLYEDTKQKYHVIDGLQRLSTIDEFMDNKFPLIELEYLRKGEYKNFKEKKIYFRNLINTHQTRIKEYQLNFNIIDPQTPKQVKYDLFRRINTGGVPLNPQELRNSIARAEIRKLFAELLLSVEYSMIINKKIEQVNEDRRMTHREMILRYIAFLQIYNPTDENTFAGYKKDTNKFLDEAFERLNSIIPEEPKKYRDPNINETKKKEYLENLSIAKIKLNEIKENFLKAMRLSHALFGEKVFRAPGKTTVNRSLFISWSIILTFSNKKESELKELRSRAELELKNYMGYSKKLENGEILIYQDAISKSTTSKKNVKFNFDVTKKIFDKVISND